MVHSPGFEQEAEVEAIVALPGREVRGKHRDAMVEVGAASSTDARGAVTAERSFLTVRRLGPSVLHPAGAAEAIVRQCWYAEPLRAKQRAFKAGVLRRAEQLGAHLTIEMRVFRNVARTAQDVGIDPYGPEPREVGRSTRRGRP
jgi:hypothetical protein